MNKVEKVLKNFIKNNSKNNTAGEAITFLVNNASKYSIDAFVLKELGFKVNIQEWENNILEDKLEQMRRADALADYVYVEKDLWTESFDDFPIRPEKDINNIANRKTGNFSDCRIGGFNSYLDYENFSCWGKYIVVFGEDVDLVDMLRIKGATVTMVNPLVQPFGMNFYNVDMIIVLPNYSKGINAYPVRVPIINCGGRVINAANRDVVSDTHLFRILGIMEQILW